MYAAHFGLIAEPFAMAPDPRYLYLGPEHREALAALEYGIRDARGFVTLVGEVGTGKTTLLYGLLGRVTDVVETGYVSYTAQPFEGVLAALLRDLDVPVGTGGKTELLAIFEAHLIAQAKRRRMTALIIDE